ncbi:pimeloyl-ACP methyl ester carboxylesterase [Pseudonocardia sediminis]|uniref:Pimeloyl-ACP methyl ester carboxylesterase n=1 Tax=Pseudonocardia sediminis TaxID=1397368 RepID=A0A4V2FR97_PSEST|nr:alpha/beta hydrolase [Pseudonocardia sediminis]RZT87810.1 pimeloyl-ACP methyl ester carboxylesterase [Pseudonocardia sediminis]
MTVTHTVVAVDRRPAVTRREVALHGQTTSFLEAGAEHGGPVVVLLHGLASSADTWSAVLPELGRHAHVIAPDLLGHGRSAKPDSGDYALGAYAAQVRDLLLVLGLDRATVVGHSFGGGVVMQYAYQFPEMVERVVLVSSGGLGPGVTPALRAATLPGAATALRVAAALTPHWMARATYRLARLGPALIPGMSGGDVDGLAAAFGSFADRGARVAFVQTVRGALDGAGQRLEGTGRFYLLGGVPVLLVVGTADPVIPVGHTRAAHALIPGSRLEVFDGAGHFPHADDPGRFAALVTDFLRTSDPAHAGREWLRRRLQAGSSGPTTSGRAG